jgi:uncharacterized protein YbaR (Trm112 family)
VTDPKPLIDPELLAIMQCPACAGDLSERHDRPALVCASCGRAYPVDDGIPVMLIDEAEPSTVTRPD